MNIWAYDDSESMWVSKIRIPSLGDSYEIPLHEDSYMKAMRSLYFGGSWPTRDPSKLEACGSPYKLVLYDDGHELSSLPDQATQGQ